MSIVLTLPDTLAVAALEKAGYTLLHITDGGSSDIHAVDAFGNYQDAAAQTIIDAYTLAEAQSYRKDQVDQVVAQKFDQALEAAYGLIPPAQQMLKWPLKEAEARAWQAWFDGGQVGAEPATPTVDAEVTATQSRQVRVAKVLAKADALEGLRAAIEHNAVVVKEQIDAATDFAGVAAVDINAGWPV